MRGCLCFFIFFFFNDTATTEIYTLSLHDALPISGGMVVMDEDTCMVDMARRIMHFYAHESCGWCIPRSEEHTSELQSRLHLVCRLLLEKKKKTLYRSEARPPIRYGNSCT